MARRRRPAPAPAPRPALHRAVVRASHVQCHPSRRVQKVRNAHPSRLPPQTPACTERILTTPPASRTEVRRTTAGPCLSATCPPGSGSSSRFSSSRSHRSSCSAPPVYVRSACVQSLWLLGAMSRCTHLLSLSAVPRVPAADEHVGPPPPAAADYRRRLGRWGAGAAVPAQLCATDHGGPAAVGVPELQAQPRPAREPADGVEPRTDRTSARPRPCGCRARFQHPRALCLVAPPQLCPRAGQLVRTYTLYAHYGQGPLLLPSAACVSTSSVSCPFPFRPCGGSALCW